MLSGGTLTGDWWRVPCLNSPTDVEIGGFWARGDHFVFVKENTATKSDRFESVFGKAMKYHFYTRQKPPISTSEGLFEPGTRPQSVSQTLPTTQVVRHKLICFLVVCPLFGWDDGERGYEMNDVCLNWLLFLRFEERWVLKPERINGASFVLICRYIFVVSSATEDGQAAWHFPGEFATSWRCNKNWNLFCFGTPCF